MSNGEMNVYERLWKLWATVCKLILDKKRDPEYVADMLQKIVDELRQRLVGDYLRLITEVTLPATSGTETLAEAADVFTGFLDPDFKNWGTNVRGEPTKETSVEVLELVNDGKFTEIYGSVGNDLDKLCLAQGQIKSFCQNHPDLISPDSATCFLFKENGEFFVARVYCDSGGQLRAFVGRFEYAYVWNAVSRLHFVLPCLR